MSALEPSFYEVDPVELPASPQTLCDSTCRIREMHITNDGPGDAVVFVGDLSGSPGLVPHVILPKGGFISLASRVGRKMTGGVQWSASQPGVGGWMVMTAVLTP